MCGDGCARNVLNLGPGVSLENIQPEDVLVCGNKKSLVTSVDESSNKIKVAERQSDNRMLCWALTNYNVVTGEFKDESFLYALDVQSSSFGHYVYISIQEAGL